MSERLSRILRWPSPRICSTRRGRSSSPTPTASRPLKSTIVTSPFCRVSMFMPGDDIRERRKAEGRGQNAEVRTRRHDAGWCGIQRTLILASKLGFTHSADNQALSASDFCLLPSAFCPEMNLILLFDDDFIAPTRVRLTGRRREHVVRVHRAAIGDELVVGVAGGGVGRGQGGGLAGEGIELGGGVDGPPPARPDGSPV